MDAIAICSGLGLLAFAAFAFLPVWWPPLWQKITGHVNQAKSTGSRFKRSLPDRWERAKSHWRGTKRGRVYVANIIPLCVMGTAWVVWSHGHPDPVKPSAFPAATLLTGAIALGVFVGGIFAAHLIFRTVGWVWEGFWREPQKTSQLPGINAQNRVGIAAPLGEAGFAKSGTVDRALKGGRPHFIPPKFRD